MIKKIFLSIIVFLLVMPGVYFYARGFSETGSAIGFTKEKRDAYKEKSELDLSREEIMKFISGNIARLLLPEISSGEIQAVDRFLFVEDSSKEVYVEYSYQGVKRKILVHVIRRDKDLFRYLLFNYFEFGKGGGWRLRQVDGEQLALDLQKFGLYEKEPLEILTYILKREKKESKLHLILHSHLILYLTTAYFEPSRDGWKLTKGNDISAGKDLEPYEYECEDNGSLKWAKKEVI